MLKFCFIAALAMLAHEPKTITGKVVAIADGDTLTVLNDAKVQHKIRLHGIDAPEKSQAFRTKARENLARRHMRFGSFLGYPPGAGGFMIDWPASRDHGPLASLNGRGVLDL
jgi:hypothetical protein